MMAIPALIPTVIFYLLEVIDRVFHGIILPVVADISH